MEVGVSMRISLVPRPSGGGGGRPAFACAEFSGKSCV